MNSRLAEIKKRPLSPSSLERAVLAGSDIIRQRVVKNSNKLVLAGAGLASLASWVAVYGIKEQGEEAELISELGFLGITPRPGEPFSLQSVKYPYLQTTGRHSNHAGYDGTAP